MKKTKNSRLSLRGKSLVRFKNGVATDQQCSIDSTGGDPTITVTTATLFPYAPRV
jgi:hypothetical protein